MSSTARRRRAPRSGTLRDDCVGCPDRRSPVHVRGLSMSLASEFKEFAMKGNVVDMAVGVIIGAAFGKIVSSLVSDVVTPPLGYIIGGVDFTKLAITMPA